MQNELRGERAHIRASTLKLSRKSSADGRRFESCPRYLERRDRKSGPFFIDKIEVEELAT